MKQVQWLSDCEFSVRFLCALDDCSLRTDDDRFAMAEFALDSRCHKGGLEIVGAGHANLGGVGNLLATRLVNGAGRKLRRARTRGGRTRS